MNISHLVQPPAASRKDGSIPAGADRVRGLDGLRAVAVTMVVVTHLGLVAGLNETAWLRTSVMPLVAGYTGVHIFFVLSGFLITLLLVREQQRTASVSVSDFFARRILRIFPVYFLVVGLTIAMELVGDRVVKTESLPFLLTYTYNFIPEPWYSSTVGHTWSLAVEEHFYVVWPFLFLFLVARYPRRLPLATALVFVVSILLSQIGQAIEFLDAHFFVERWSMVAGGFIALGATVALLVEWSAHRAQWRHRLGGPAAVLLGLALFAHSLPLDLGAYAPQVRGIGIALLVGWIYLNQRSVLVRGLELPPLRYLGRISDGIDLWQGFFLATGPDRLPGQTWPPGTWTGLILLALVAPLSYHGFERPFLRLKARFRPEAPRPHAETYGAKQQASTF